MDKGEEGRKLITKLEDPQGKAETLKIDTAPQQISVMLEPAISCLAVFLCISFPSR